MTNQGPRSGTVWQCWARARRERGKVGARHGLRHGTARSASARLERGKVGACQGMVWIKVRLGWEWLGPVRAWYGLWRGWARRGLVGPGGVGCGVRFGIVWSGQAGSGAVGHGAAWNMARFGWPRLGLARRGLWRVLSMRWTQTGRTVERGRWRFKINCQ